MQTPLIKVRYSFAFIGVLAGLGVLNAVIFYKSFPTEYLLAFLTFVLIICVLFLRNPILLLDTDTLRIKNVYGLTLRRYPRQSLSLKNNQLWTDEQPIRSYNRWLLRKSDLAHFEAALTS